MEILQTPDAFRPPSPPFPTHHRGPNVEESVGNYLFEHRDEIKTDWIYVPIYWWNCTAQRRLPTGHYYATPEVQQFVDQALKPDQKYFTISQGDDGVYERLPTNIIVFSAGGTGDIPLPLLCSPHKIEDMTRDCKVFFCGNVATGGPEPEQKGRSGWHPDGAGARTRREMFRVLNGRPGWDFRDQKGMSHKSVKEFEHLLSRSVFGLCPRGYGRTSFRLYECIQCGCIPVYIYDDAGPWIPYSDVINWEHELGPVVHVDRLADLPDDLDRCLAEPMGREHIEKTRKRMAELWPNFFTFYGMSQQVARMVVDPGFPEKFKGGQSWKH